jgi:hypothetical protein
VDCEAIRFLSALLDEEWSSLDRSARAIDPPRLAAFLDRHRLAGAAFSLLDRHGRLSAIAPEVARSAEARYLDQWAWNQKIRRSLRDVLDAFERSSIDFVYLKGLHLGHVFYGDPDARWIGDIDVLVRFADQQRALRVLEAIGFRRSGTTSSVDRWLKAFTHHLEIERGGVLLDLHHSLRTYPGMRPPDAEVWDGVTLLELENLRLPILSSEHALLMSLLTVHDDLAKRRFDLRALADVHRILRAIDREMNWPGFRERRGRDGTWRICVNAIFLWLLLFGGEAVAPRAAAFVKNFENELVERPTIELFGRLIEGAGVVERKLWAFRQYPVPLACVIGWWLAGLPVLAVADGRRFVADGLRGFR